MNDTPSLLPPIKAKLTELVRFASTSRLKVHSGCEAIVTSEMPEKFQAGRVLANNMVLILTSGEPVRVTFKAHFNMATARAMASRIFGDLSAQAVTDRRSFDYMKEYCNLVAGKVVTLFADLQIDLGISLPQRARGFYEVFADYQEKDKPNFSFSDFWILSAGEHTITCSAVMEILDLKRLESLVDCAITDSSDDEEMDFL
jgi:CheY-specific phosphatase CheX